MKKMIFKETGIPICVADACCGVALIFQIVAVACTSWLVFEDGEAGLFRFCAWGVCLKFSSDMTPDWWKAVQAFSILTLLTILGSLALGILHFFVEGTDQVSLADIAFCSFSVIFLIIELAVFVAKSHDFLKYGYGFILSVIACVLSAIAGMLFGVGRESFYE